MKSMNQARLWRAFSCVTSHSQTVRKETVILQ
jgi:hypothetical protein